MMGQSVISYWALSLLFLVQQAIAQAATVTQSVEKPANTGYNGGEDNPQDPSDAGAEGASKGSFSLSKGGIAAIIVVAVLVVVVGVGSAVLFWLAKKRQWDVRQSLRRASRRLTGRSTTDLSKRQNRRTGVRLNSPPRPNRKPTQERDLEKGASQNSRQPETTTTITSTFDVDTPTQKGWKASVLGGKK